MATSLLVTTDDLPTLQSSILSGDLCRLIIGHLDLADLGAISQCLCGWSDALHDAINATAVHIIGAVAPLGCAAGDFAKDALLKTTFEDIGWRPRPFFAALCSPAGNICKLIVGPGPLSVQSLVRFLNCIVGRSSRATLHSGRSRVAVGEDVLPFSPARRCLSRVASTAIERRYCLAWIRVVVRM